MKYTSALIIYSGRQHNQHNKILSDLQEEKIEQKQLQLPDTEGTSCASTSDIDNAIVDIDLLIVYLSKHTKDHPCIDYCVNVAHSKNIKIIGIWLDGAEANDINKVLDQVGDGICNYDESFIDNIINEPPTWTNPDGSPPEKRIIKKHICG
jgi:MTH538 TIR-like domain (DUF1863)